MSSAEAFDVAVVGGGLAGVAAALAANRLGARTLLVERHDVLGGNAATAQVHTICGLYLAVDAGAATEGQGSAAPELAHPGFPREFAAGLGRAGAAGPAVWAGRVAVLPTDPAGLTEHADRVCSDASELTVWKRSELESAELSQAAGEPSRLGIGRAGERTHVSHVSARIVVDTSGDGAVAHAGGADWDLSAPDELQAASYIFMLTGVDSAPLEGLGRMKVSHAVACGVRAGELSPSCGSLTLRPGLQPGEVYVTLNVPKLEGRPFAPLDEEYRQCIEQTAREASQEVATFLAATRPEFARARISALPRRIGIRETRRLRGVTEISAADILAGHRPDDEVALSTWPIELWRDHRRAHFQHPKAAAGVPLGALISGSHPSLGMAGRCLSASHEALGALRVLGTALATGEAIGVAAGLAAAAGEPLTSVRPDDVRRGILRIAEGRSGR